ncbi:M24 family metallopeptidase [Planococcus sp. 1R117A]|uniref:M24 family metallopeptidase n=1 Tax=Planococcus sp. 1R117A TaxID=3447020 RepID=UPI003EDBD5AB
MTILEKIRSRFDDYEIDGLMINGDWNRRYVSGFTGSNGIVLITRSEAKLLTDYRYFEQAKNQSNLEVVLHAEHTGHKHKIYGAAAKLIAEMRIKRLGFEQQHLSFGNYSLIKNQIDTELIPVYDFIENIRMIKTSEEIEKIRISSDITDRAYLHVLEFIRPGVPEIAVAAELEDFIKKNGGVTSTFSPIVASGKRSSLPHGRASDKVIEKGDMVTIDFGTNYEGYWSDISRTVSLGEPDERLKEIQKVILESLNNCESHIKAGLTDKEVDMLMRENLRSTGYESFAGTGTGHGIGLEVHEKPLFSVDSEKMLMPGMVVTIEPGIYLPGIGGGRIEDMLLITEEGCEVLSPSSKELVII